MKDDQASSTAYTVLQGILYVAETSKYKDLVDPEIITVGRQILEHSEEGRHRLKQLQSQFFVKVSRLRERILLPGISLHYVLRKRHVETIAKAAIANGKTQVIMLGAGFDTLPWRLHSQHPHVNFIEIDHPATQKEKVRALDKDRAKGSNLNFLSVDFTHQDLKSRLLECLEFDDSRETLFICEGVMMYLDTDAIDVLFNSIRTLTGKNSEFVFSTLEPRSSSKNSVPNLLYLYLKFIGEPIVWDIDSYKMPRFIEKRNCEVLSIAGRDELIKEQIGELLDTNIHQGEYFVHCRFL